MAMSVKVHFQMIGISMQRGFRVDSIPELVHEIKVEWSKIIPCTLDRVEIHLKFSEPNDMETETKTKLDNFQKFMQSEKTPLPNKLITFLSFTVAVYPYGNGITSLTGKRSIGNFTFYSNEGFSYVKPQIGRSVPGVDFELYRNDRFKPGDSILVTDTPEFLQCKEINGNKFAAFYLLLHDSYSQLVFKQVSSFLTFPQMLPGFTDRASKHHEILTNASDLLGQPLSTIKASTASNPTFKQTFDQYIEMAIHFLELFANQTAAKSSYSEKCRRTLIDIVIYTALGINNNFSNCRREIAVEKELFTDKVLDPDIVGKGPLDYSIPEGIILNCASEQGEEEEGVENQEGEENEPEEEKDKNVFIDVEAKVDLEDKSLYQLLGQLHDSMYVVSDEGRNKRKAEKDDPTQKLKVARKHVVGVLTTGHRWEFYTMTYLPDERKSEVYFLGRRTLKVLRYLTTSRTSSYFVQSSMEIITVNRQEVEEVIYVLLAVLDGIV
jgi:hypothetical protein